MVVGIFVVHCASIAQTVVMRCDIGTPAHPQKVELLRSKRIADTHVYSIRLVPSRENQFLFADAQESRGSNVRYLCAGKDKKSLVVSGEFTSNFLKGVALVYRQQRIEKLEFADRARPQWLYLGEDSIAVVMPTNGRGEVPEKYVSYTHAFGDSQETQQKGLATLAPTHTNGAAKLW
jgi:hypothetical protein